MKISVKVFSVIVVFGLFVTAIGYILGGKINVDATTYAAFFPHTNASVDYISGDAMPSQIIVINTTSVNISIVPSNSFSCKIVEPPQMSINCYVSEGALVFESKEPAKSWKVFDLKSLKMIEKQAQIIISVPSTQSLSNVELETTFGSFSVEGLMIDKLTLDTTKGNIKLKNVTVQQLVACVGSGNITVENSSIGQMEGTPKTPENGSTITSLVGNINVLNSQIWNLPFYLQKGNFFASNLITGNMSVTNSMGNIRIDGKLSGNTQLSDKAGNISIVVNGRKDDYQVSTKSVIGDTKIDGERKTIQASVTQGYQIAASTEIGNVNIQFKQDEK